MDPIPFRGQSRELIPKPGSRCDYPLPVLETKEEWISCWQLDAEEIQRVLTTGRVWVRITRVGRASHPPIALQASDPLGTP